MAQRIKCAGNPIQKPGSDRFPGFRGKIGPDFGEISFSGVGKTKNQGLANNFLPRAMIFFGSKSVTRPAAISAKP